MCGRFVLTADPSIIQQAFDLETVPAEFYPRYNIAPTQPVAVITNEDPKTLTFHRWGLIPSWAKDISIGSKMINARAETVEEKPSFRSAFKRRRCLIPANGFYEWTQRDKDKVPVYIHLQNHEVFAFAGLWESWFSPDGSEIRTCTILTAEPNEMVRSLHNRMAVILPKEDYETWLSPDELPAAILKPLLQPYAAERMAYYEVSKLVNSPAHDSPDCIAPIVPPQREGLL